MSDDQKRSWGFTFTEVELPGILIEDTDARGPHPATMRVVDQYGNMRVIPGHIVMHDGKEIIAFDEENARAPA